MGAVRGHVAEQLRCDCRGGVLVEHLIVSVPILLFALATWQLTELCLANLLMRRAAAAAARAATVILPDDPAHYGGVPVHDFSGRRRVDIELAASLVLAASSDFRSRPEVDVALTEASRVLTATVRADYRCRYLAVLCGDGVRLMEGAAAVTYQSAPYRYD